MANKKPSNGFDKDRTRASLAGKKSSTALPPEVKAARQMNGPMFELLINKYMGLPVDQLQVIAKDPATPAIDLVVIKLLVMSIQHGDINRLKLLLEYTIGRVTDKLQIDANVTTQTLHDIVMKEIEDGNK